MLICIKEKNKKSIYKALNDIIEFEKEKYKFFGRLSPLQVPGFVKMEYVSMEKGKFLGYMSTVLDLKNQRLINLSLLAFKFNKEFRKDFLFFLDNLYKCYENFEFRVCTSSPAFKMDQKLFKKYGFEQFGPLKNSIKIDGKYYDEYIFHKNKRA